LLVLIVVAIGMHLPYWRKKQKNDKQRDAIKTSDCSRISLSASYSSREVAQSAFICGVL
jgi:hypothetical protein